MQVDYNRIPEEMKAYHQFLVWRYEDRGGLKPTKVPYDPRTARLASVTDPATWCSFAEAVHFATAPGTSYDGIGFVLTLHDPFVFFDLDKTTNPEEQRIQVDVYNALDSYSEFSPSGAGLHVIVKAQGLLQGRRRSNIEVYSNERYMTMTGAVFRDKPIEVREELVKGIWEQMAGSSRGAYSVESQPQNMSDAEVINKALNAVNGMKFKDLLEGNWQGMYPSQSEADISFIDIVAFYTQNVDQIIRLFWNCPLGHRDKAQRVDYVMSMIHRSFDRMLPPVNLIHRQEAIVQAIVSGNLNGGTQKVTDNKPLRDEITKKLKALNTPEPLSFPPGLVGDIAQYIYDVSPYPAVPVSLVGALGLMAGICGRCYNVSGTGLNLYLLLLAKTAVGKEAMSRGISKLLSAVTVSNPDKSSVPAANNFIGPAEMASGQSVLRWLTDENHRSFVSILGEFGLTMQKLAHPRASSSEIMLKKVLLDLYNKSGKDDILGSSSYAQKENNTAPISSPSVTIIGESTPSTFYEAIDEKLITDGLLPRFIFVEHDAPRPRLNKKGLGLKPPAKLIADLMELATYSLELQRGCAVINVKMTPEAELFFDTLEELTGDFINATENDALRDLWSRAYMKTAKVASLIAVGNNRYETVIELSHAQWAYNLISADILTIHNRFIRGEIGKNNEEAKQGKLILRTCIDYMTADFNEIKTYNTSRALHKMKIVPYTFLQRKLNAMACFRNDPRTARRALNESIQNLVDAGDLEEIGKGQLIREYNFKGRAFTLGSPEHLPRDI